MAQADADYVAWVNAVHALGGIATAWPFAGVSYGRPAARFPADTFATLANAGQLPMAAGVQFNTPGTWVYVLASAMTGSSSVDDSAQAMVNATTAEAEQACAIAGNCGGTSLEGIVRDVVIGIGLLAGVFVISKFTRR